MTRHQIREHTPRHIVPADNHRRLDWPQTPRPETDRGMWFILGAMLLALAAGGALAFTAQNAWMAHIEEVLENEL